MSRKTRVIHVSPATLEAEIARAFKADPYWKRTLARRIDHFRATLATEELMRRAGIEPVVPFTNFDGPVVINANEKSS